MAYGNLALDLVLKRKHGRLVNLTNGRYGDVPLDIVVSANKNVNIEKYYNTDRLRPSYKSFQNSPFFIVTGS